MSANQITRAYLKPSEVAELLGIEHAKVLAWIHAGELLAVDISEKRGPRARFRISREALNAFLEARQNKPTPKPRHAISRRQQVMAGVKKYFRK